MSESNDKIIVFENLRRSADIIGEEDVVIKAIVQPFVSDNAHGVLRKVSGYEEVALLGAKSGEKIRRMLSTDE